MTTALLVFAMLTGVSAGVWQVVMFPRGPMMARGPAVDVLVVLVWLASVLAFAAFVGGLATVAYRRTRDAVILACVSLVVFFYLVGTALTTISSSH